MNENHHPISEAAIYRNLVDRLMPEHAQLRAVEDRARAAMAAADFLAPDWSDLTPIKTMTLREAVALVCGINRRYAWTIEHRVGDGAARATVEGAHDLLKFLIAEHGVTPKTDVPLKRMAKWMRDAGLPLPAGFPGAAAPIEASSQPATSTPAEGIRTVRVGERGRLAIAPAIEAAQALCANKFDTTSVWAQLQVLAKGEEPPAPLVGATGVGLKYLDNGVENSFTRKQLSDYLGKRKRRRRAP